MSKSSPNESWGRADDYRFIVKKLKDHGVDMRLVGQMTERGKAYVDAVYRAIDSGSDIRHIGFNQSLSMMDAVNGEIRLDPEDIFLQMAAGSNVSEDAIPYIQYLASQYHVIAQVDYEGNFVKPTQHKKRTTAMTEQTASDVKALMKTPIKRSQELAAFDDRPESDEKRAA